MEDGFDLYPPSRASPALEFKVPTNRRFIKKAVFGERGRVIVCGSDHGLVYLFSPEETNPVQVLKHGEESELIQTVEVGYPSSLSFCPYKWKILDGNYGWTPHRRHGVRWAKFCHMSLEAASQLWITIETAIPDLHVDWAGEENPSSANQAQAKQVRQRQCPPTHNGSIEHRAILCCGVVYMRRFMGLFLETGMLSSKCFDTTS